MAKILIVDDEVEIADLIEVYLISEGHEIRKAHNATDALRMIGEDAPDLAILDVMLPDMDGFTILKRVRETLTFPVIMLTAKDGEINQITGLTLGADDYVTKPFRPLEMVARVKAQLRRYTKYNQMGAENKENVIAFSGLVLNRDTHQLLLDEREVQLTPTEFNILWFLCENRGRVVSSEELFHAIWGEKYFTASNNTVMVHIRHLREKMNDSFEKPRYIKTVWGVGYKIEK